MLLPAVTDLALKEWAVAVKALSCGEQIMILRKGGIHQNDKNFRMIHPEFLLYPTYEHQHVELLKPDFHDLMKQTLLENDILGLVTLTYWCEVTDKYELVDEATLDAVSDYHIWTSDYARSRFHWRPKTPLTIALLRVYELQQPQALPILKEYNGCKSWVELGQDLPLGYMAPVLTDLEYDQMRNPISEVLGSKQSIV